MGNNIFVGCVRGWAEKYYVLLRAPRKPNPPAPLPYEGMGVISLSPFRREVWREVPSIVIDALLHPLRRTTIFQVNR